MAPIIEDWVSNSDDESEPNDPQSTHSFVQTSEHVRPFGHYVQPVEAPILAATPKPTSPKTNCSGKRKNRKTCFVCKSVDHLIKDCNFHAKPNDQPTPKNYAHKAQVVSVAKGKKEKWVWRSKCVILDHDSSASKILKRFDYNDALGRSNGCSRHMTWNMSYLSDFQELNGGYVTFGGNPKGGKILDKGKIKTGKLDFEDVYFVKEMKFNLFSVSQMCDKKNKFLFTDSECLVLSINFKLPDESQVLLRVPRENNMYNVNLKDIIPSRDLTCLFAKATINESNLWHRRLGHGIKREFSVPRTPQQNVIAERKNRTLIEAARTMMADSLLPIPFWAEAVNTACYVQNRVLVTKPHNKTLYELLHGRTSSIGFMRPFGCPMTILNTLDPLGKFERKVDEGFLVGYPVNSKAFRVFNNRTRIVQETLHVNFLENKSNIVGIVPTWLFDIDSLTTTMNYQPITVGNQSNLSAGFQKEFDTEKAGEEAKQQYMLFTVWSTRSLNLQNKEGDAAFDGKEHDAEKPESTVNLSLSSSALSGEQDDMNKKKDKEKSPVEYFTGNRDLNADFKDYSEDISNNVSVAGPIVPTAGDASQPPEMLERENIAYSNNENVGAKADFNNLETSITVSPIPTTRTHKDHPVSQIISDLSSTTQTRSMTRVIKDQGGLLQIFNDDFHTCMFTCFLSQEEPKRKVWILVDLPHGKRAIVARIEAIRLFLAYASFMGFMVYQMDVKSAFLYGTIEEEVYVFQPLGFEDSDHPDKVKQKKDRIFISQDKYVAEILKKFGLTKGKSASTPINTEKPLLKDPDGFPPKATYPPSISLKSVR
nr:putative ribonuclease H-like domain-containing protein [Tanacetum cinerariifolium]